MSVSTWKNKTVWQRTAEALTEAFPEKSQNEIQEATRIVHQYVTKERAEAYEAGVSIGMKAFGG